MSLSELHNQGGLPFMFPLDIIFLINVGLVLFAVYCIALKKSMQPNLLDNIKKLASFALTFGAFSTLVGLFFAFSALEEIKEGLAFYIIAGGLKVGLITALYGCVIYLISMLAFLILRAVQKVPNQ